MNRLATKFSTCSQANSGYVAVISVLIISIVVIGIALTVSFLGIGEGQASWGLTRGNQTLSFVDGCAEDALLKSKNNPSYSGGTITRPEGTCQVNISKAGNNWTLTVTTTATDYRRTLIINIVRSSQISINSWQEQ